MAVRRFFSGFNSCLFIGVILLGSVAGTAACSTKSNTAQVKIAVVGDDIEEWRPTIVGIKVGGTVHWNNNGNTIHQVVSNQGLWTPQQIPPAGSFSYTFTKAGTYTYHDEADTWTGTVEVK